MVIEAKQQESFARQVNNASLVLADGMPLVKTLKFFYGVNQDRIPGMDMLPDVLKEAEKNHLSVFFFGSTPDILSRIETRVKSEYPELQIAGLYSPPFDQSLDNPSYLEMINTSQASLVFVALGCPKQEKWMANHHHKMAAVLLGVGGAFPVFAQVAKRAPLIMQNLGLEWMFRLLQEPRRLFTRYLYTNSSFIYYVLKIKMSQILKRKSSKHFQ
jgi:N-acetylglucosaminyldiphosphoundecaprenol N-acetyl-beta-D-mannosaminyltransferase